MAVVQRFLKAFFFFFAGHDVSLLHVLSYYSRKTKVLLFSSLKCENWVLEVKWILQSYTASNCWSQDLKHIWCQSLCMVYWPTVCSRWDKTYGVMCILNSFLEFWKKKKKALSLSYSVLTDRLNRNFVMNGNLQVALTFKICVWDEGWCVQDPSNSASEWIGVLLQASPHHTYDAISGMLGSFKGRLFHQTGKV